MRLPLAIAALAACTPDVPPGSYLCGPEGLCPGTQVCNGPNNRCVLPGKAEPFACLATDPADDDAPATGTVLGTQSCPSLPTESAGCLDRFDRVDFYQFDVPGACAAARVEASVVFPIAFEPVVLLFSTGGAAAEPVETPCSAQTPPAGHDQRCFSQAVQAGGHYAIGVAREGVADCDGVCPHNRYRLGFLLAAP